MVQIGLNNTNDARITAGGLNSVHQADGLDAWGHLHHSGQYTVQK